MGRIQNKNSGDNVS